MTSTQQTGDTLLTYELATSPAPLQVSPETGPPSIGNLQFVISCPLSAGSVTVSKIMFKLPIGDPSNPDATDLTDNAIVISPSVSSSGTDQWQIGPGPASGQFALIPQTGQPGIINAQGLIVTISGIQVSAIVGTATITIDEKASDASVPVAQIRTCTIPVPKFPYGFNVDNFTASSPSIQNNLPVTLKWIGSVGATYTILYGTQNVDVSKVNSWTSPVLTETTTFILQVAAQEAGQTVNFYDSLTVIVEDADITASTLEVLQNATFNSSVLITDSKVGNDDCTQLTIANTTGISTSRCGIELQNSIGNWYINTDNAYNFLEIYSSTNTPIGLNGTVNIIDPTANNGDQLQLVVSNQNGAANSGSGIQLVNCIGAWNFIADNQKNNLTISTSNGPLIVINETGNISTPVSFIDSNTSVAVAGWTWPQATISISNGQISSSAGYSVGGVDGYSFTNGGGSYGYYAVTLGQPVSGMLIVLMQVASTLNGIAFWDIRVTDSNNNVSQVWGTYQAPSWFNQNGDGNGFYPSTIRVAIPIQGKSIAIGATDLNQGQAGLRIVSVDITPF